MTLMKSLMGATALLAQREALLRVAEAHECWIYQPLAADAREQGLQATGIAMSLTAALILYDNYLSAVAPFRQPVARRQQDDGGQGNLPADAALLLPLPIGDGFARRSHDLQRAGDPGGVGGREPGGGVSGLD